MAADEPVFGGLVVRVAEQLPQPGVFDRMHAWKEAYFLWQSALRSENTRRAYAVSWESLLSASGKYPWEINATDIYRWVNGMRELGLSQATVNQRVAGISSFYRFVVRNYRITLPDGHEATLRVDNPAESSELRVPVNPYGKTTYLGVLECRALLAAIPRSTVQGLRDYALLLGYLYTGRRNSEWRTIRWEQFERKGHKVYYVWSGKGKKEQRFELPITVWEAVLAYLRASGRETLVEGEYIFLAVTDRAKRLPNVGRGYCREMQPLSARQVGALLKHYARRAGLDEKKVHVHTLRHSAAMLRVEVGDDVEKISAFLAHSSLAVTQIYLHSLEGKQDDSWAKLDTLLGL